jgi:hypothetical protein
MNKAPDTASGGLNPFRAWMINGFILFLLGATGVSAWTQKEYWPICHYPMFAGVRAPKDFSQLEIYLLNKGGESKLPLESKILFRDFDIISARTVMQKISREKNSPAEQATQVEAFLILLLDYFICHARSPDVPSGIRVYNVRYALRSSGPARAQPLRRTLVAEWVKPVP